MKILLSKESDVPLHQQLAEQIVFLITTGRLRPSQDVESVRSVARRLKIHHNTVSKAYQDLVRRGWLTRRRGSRLCVRSLTPRESKAADARLDTLINNCIAQAREAGFPLQLLQTRVLARIFAQPPDHILVVEEELGLRRVIQAEIRSAVGRHVESCSLEEFIREPKLAIGAQIVALDYALPALALLLPHDRPPIPIKVASADEHIAVIRRLQEPSVVGVTSVSNVFVKIARSLLAPILGERHAFRDFTLPPNGRLDLDGIDIAFCDSLAISAVRCRRMFHYRLIATDCLSDIASILQPPSSKKLLKMVRKPSSRSSH